MKLVLLLLVIYISFSLTQNVRTVNVESDELNRSNPVEIYLPPNYSTSGEGYPVLIFLHGTELDHSDYPEVISVVDELVKSGDFPDIIVAKPNGNWQAPTPEDIWDCASMPSWWINNDIFGDFEDFVSGELIEWLDDNYNINTNRIILAGHSAGGFGAYNIGFRHPDVFSAVFAFSGAVFLEQIANDSIKSNNKWWINYDGEGIVRLEEYYDGSNVPPDPSTLQSPELGYFSDLQWKLNYVFSPKTSDNVPLAFDRNDVSNIFVGSPDEDTIENIAVSEDVSNKWMNFNIDTLLRKNKKEVEKLDFLYFDVGAIDDFNLQDDAAEIHSIIEEEGILINYYYEQFNTGIGCVQCIPGFDCQTGDYPCGKHFADRDDLAHGSCQSRFYNGLPYTGALRSRLQLALTKLAPIWINGLTHSEDSTINSSASPASPASNTDSNSNSSEDTSNTVTIGFSFILYAFLLTIMIFLQSF